MLSVEQTKYAQQYQFRNGMVNVVWLAGLLRRVNATRTEGFIQRSNNLNQMLHFRCESGVTIPRAIQEGEPIKIIARMHSARAHDEYSVELRVLKFDQPSIFDMPPRKAWEQPVPAGVPVDGVRPEAFGDDAEAKERMNGENFTDSSNTVEVAGYLCGLAYEQPTKTGGNGSLIVHLRQTKNPDEVIVCRTNTRDAKAAYKLMGLGDQLYAKGKMSVRLKNTGEPPDEAGVLPTRRFQHVQVSIWKPATRSHITAVPPWVDELRQARNSARQQKASAEGVKAEMRTGQRISRDGSVAPAPAMAEPPSEANSASAEISVITAPDKTRQVSNSAMPAADADVSTEVLNFLRGK